MSRVRSRYLVLAAIGLTAGPAVASSVASAAPAARVVTHQGLRVSLPGGKTILAGAKLSVAVRPTGSGGARTTARVTISRDASAGEKAAVVARRSLRRGTVGVRVAATAGIRYRVAVRIGAKRWSTRLVTAAAGKPAPTPTTGPCAPSGTLTADVASVAAGGAVPYHLTNTSKTSLTYGSGNGWRQLVDGAWRPVFAPSDLPASAAHTIAPGETQTGIGRAWSTLTPGTYSMNVVVTCGDQHGDSTTFKGIVLQTLPLTVTAAAGR